MPPLKRYAVVPKGRFPHFASLSAAEAEARRLADASHNTPIEVYEADFTLRKTFTATVTLDETLAQ